MSFLEAENDFVLRSSGKKGLNEEEEAEEELEVGSSTVRRS